MITSLTRKIRLSALILASGLAGTATGQTSLDTYVEYGLQHNIVLQEKNISLSKAMYALKAANSMFLPSIGIKGDYQTGQGGRSINLPIGDLLNPVYSTLNELTNSNNFPQVQNAETYFLPRNYYDLKVRTSMPIFNSDLVYNRKIQNQQVILQKYDIDIYTKELTKNIKVAYYNYLSALQSVSIYESALNLAREGKRINESLLNNGKSLKAYVLRSESEIQNLEAARTEAMQQLQNAQMYFNFLINAENNTPPDTTGNYAVDNNLIEQYILAEASPANRTELKALDQSASLYETRLKMNKSYWVPRVSGFVDLGSQAYNWQFNNKSKYYFAGISLDIPLFASGKNMYQVKQSELDVKNQSLNRDYVNRQLQLSVDMARNNLGTLYAGYNASRKQTEAANAYYNLIEKGYREGVNSFIETIDARNQRTTASLKLVINKYQLLAALATYEREINQ